MDETAPTACPTCGSWWRLPLLLALVLVAILWSRGCNTRETATPSIGSAPDNPATKGADDVSLTVDFGDGRQRYTAESAWQNGMTIADLMSHAPGLKIVQQDSGESAFLTEIDGVRNEGAGGRNWMYSVNDKHGDRSFGIYELKPGDQVLWTFAPEQ